eukprot:TRINITY_DN68175_c4_g1_i2.p1 TRINITY_DN68175_c4_g1~~TRINITY_DN68175_c4_g1_i2.p1  ORF type:complete len:187 (+),score=23.70 TRINITY_DN68175_c4_g1_i2:58-561(+)
MPKPSRYTDFTTYLDNDGAAHECWAGDDEWNRCVKAGPKETAEFIGWIVDNLTVEVDDHGERAEQDFSSNTTFPQFVQIMWSRLQQLAKGGKLKTWQQTIEKAEAMRTLFVGKCLSSHQVQRFQLNDLTVRELANANGVINKAQSKGLQAEWEKDASSEWTTDNSSW